MKKMISIFILLLPFTLLSQTYDWVAPMGGTGMDFADVVIRDDDGNCYVTGFYRSKGFTIGEVTLPHVDNMDSFFAKFDKDGKLIWAIPLYGPGVFDRTEALALDDEGNILLTTTVQETMMIGDQDTIMVSDENNGDIVLMKFSPMGDLLWKKVFGGPALDICYNMKRFKDHIYMVGNFYEGIDIDGTILTSLGNNDMFIVKLSLEGDVLWIKQYGGEGRDRLYDIDFVADGTMAVSGYTEGGWMFGDQPIEDGKGLHQGFVAKIDADGDPVWANQIFNQDDIRAQIYGVATDDEGNIYAASHLEGKNSIGNMDFDAGNSYQFVLIQYDPAGSINWLHVAELNNSDDFNTAGEVTFHNGHIWVGGAIGQDIGLFNKQFSDVDSTNFYIAILDKQGNLVGDFYESSFSDSQIWGFLPFDNKGLFLIWANGDVTLDNQNYTTEQYDIFLSQIDLSTTVSTIEKKIPAAITVFPNPTTDYFEIKGVQLPVDKIELLDANGKVVFQAKDKRSWNLDGLPAGNYYLMIKRQLNSFVTRIIKM